jgi:phosphatidylglycerol:prolipoprotein diacylglycerol transferase
MFPILLKLGIFRIYSYGLFVALGFLAGAKIFLIQARREKIPDNVVYDLVLVVLISAIAGARLLYVFFNLNEYLHHPLNILHLWRGGLVFQGGLVGVGLAVIVFCRIKHLDLRKTGDWIAPASALGHAFGRIGCFLAGCCYGTPTKVPWAVVFNNSLFIRLNFMLRSDIS